VVKDVIDLYTRKYARLGSESALLNSRQPSEDEARRQLKSLQKKLRKQERERFVTADVPARKGFNRGSRFFSSILARLRAMAQDARREKKGSR
jgi:hypothetical protein